jgi:hypothetical protein
MFATKNRFSTSDSLLPRVEVTDDAQQTEVTDYAVYIHVHPASLMLPDHYQYILF